MADEIQQLVAVTPLVVVPGNQLHKVIVQHDAGLGVKDGGVRIGVEVGGNDVLIGVIHNALQLALAGSLYGLADLLIGGGLGQRNGQVNNRNIQRGNTEGHTGQLALQLGDDQSAGLGSAGGGGDDVAGCGTAAAPILLGSAVYGLLGAGGGMNGGHQTLNDAEVIVDDLGQRRQAVGGAAGVGNNVHILAVGVVVNAHNKGGSLGVLGGGGDDDLLGAALQVGLALFGGGKNAGGLYDIVSAYLAPRNFSGVHQVKDFDRVTVYRELFVLDLHGAVEAAVDGVVLGHVNHVVTVDGGIVDRNHLVLFRLLHCGAEYQSADTAESVDTDFDCHKKSLLIV